MHPARSLAQNRKNSFGFTIVDVMVFAALLVLLVTSALLVISPTEMQRRARDEKRLADLSKLESAINSYKIDNDRLPDSSDILRESNVLPAGNTGPVESVAGGWIDANFTTYVITLPTDPTNDATYHYSYQHNGKAYELNARLEYNLDLAQNDGGDDTDQYEVGDLLNIISPIP